MLLVYIYILPPLRAAALHSTRSSMPPRTLCVYVPLSTSQNQFLYSSDPSYISYVYSVKSKIWNRNIDILKEDEVFRVSNFYIILNNFIMNNIVLLKNMWFVSKERITTTWSHIQGNLKYKPSLPCVHNWEISQKDTTPMLFRTVTLQINQSYEFP